MKTTILGLIAFVLLMSTDVFAQHFLQLDDGFSHYTIIKAAPGVNATFFFPTGSGTVMTLSGSISPVWLCGANSSPVSANLGTLTPQDLVMVTTNIPRSTFAATPSASTPLWTLTNTAPGVQRLRINGSIDATNTSTLAANPGVWDLVVDGDKIVTGLLKTGGSVWIDGNSATHSITANKPLTIKTTSTDPLTLSTNSASRMTIDRYGYVGIGTTTPVSPLHIQATPPDPTFTNQAGFLVPDPVNHVLTVENLASNTKGNGIAVIIHNPSGSLIPFTSGGDGSYNNNQSNYVTFYNDAGDHNHIKGRVEGFSYENYKDMYNSLISIIGNGGVFNPFNYFQCNLAFDPNFIQFHSDFIQFPSLSFSDLSYQACHDFGGIDFGLLGTWHIGSICLPKIDFGNVIPSFSGGSIGSPITFQGPPITGLTNPFSINYGYINNLVAQLQNFPYKSKAATIISNPLAAAVNFGSSLLGGVTFESGAGDYAEWLERADHNEKINVGDVVGVIGGKITKNTEGVSQLMVASWNPCVLGNTPEEGKEQFSNKVAFMGQVPVKVNCCVKKGDYIVPDGHNLGYAKAISPENISEDQFENVLGIAWDDAPNYGAKFVKIAVGLKPDEMVKVIQDQAQQLSQLQEKVAELDILQKEVDEIKASMNPSNPAKYSKKRAKHNAKKTLELSSN